MELFDKKFVHFMWDDSLKGKEGFVASTIRLIINCVENDVRINHWQKLEESRSTDLPFHSVTGVDYGFAYYDPNYEVKRAYVQGKTIQFKSHRNYEWEDCDDPVWSDCYEYRVKPEKKWRPFKDIQELKQTWEIKQGPLAYSELEEPIIWVRSEANPKSTYLITHYCENMGVVYLCGYLNTGLEQLFDDYTFLDGTPCGVEE